MRLGLVLVVVALLTGSASALVPLTATNEPTILWVPEEIPTSHGSKRIDMEVGPDGTIHVVEVRHGTPAYDLWYAARSPLGTWTSMTWPTINHVWHTASVAVGPDGLPHIFAAKAGDVPGQENMHSPHHLWLQDGVWQDELVTLGGYGINSRSVVGPDGRLHAVATCSSGPDPVCYYTRDPVTGAWSWNVVHDTAFSAWSDITVLPDGSPVVVYPDRFVHGGGLVLARQVPDGSWESTILDEYGGLDMGVTSDRHGRLHIAYEDAGEDLAYAREQEDGTFTFTTLATSGRLGRFADIEVDDNDQVHISSWEVRQLGVGTDYFLGNTWYHTQYPDGTWQREQVNTRYVTDYPVLALDPNDLPVVVYNKWEDRVTADKAKGIHLARPLAASVLEKLP